MSVGCKWEKVSHQGSVLDVSSLAYKPGGGGRVACAWLGRTRRLGSPQIILITVCSSLHDRAYVHNHICAKGLIRGHESLGPAAERNPVALLNHPINFHP